jgi:hypothetical protein
VITAKMERHVAITAAKVLEQHATEYRRVANDPANKGKIRASVLAVTLADAGMLEDAAKALRRGAERAELVRDDAS